jgi:hypothetical protein
MPNFLNPSKSIGLLERLSCDLNSLYCFTKDARIENLFIKIAESNENEIQEFLNLLYDGKFKKLSHLKKLITALKNIQNTPAGLTPSEFVTYSLNTFPASVPIIISLSQLRNLNLPILHPLSKKLALTGHFQKGKDEEIESVLKDITTLNNELQNFLKAKTESEYEDELVAKQPKQNKKEKIRTMTMFLVDKFGAEVTSGFQNSHLASVASKIGDSLLNPASFLTLVPDAKFINAGMLAQEAISIAKEVLKKIEPHNFDSNYEFIKARVFRFAGVISSSEFSVYYNKILMRDLNKTYGTTHDSDMSVENLNVHPSQWTNPTAIILLSQTLFRIASQSV